MKTSSTVVAFGLMSLATAAPADVVRRQAPSTAYATSYAVGTASASLYPSSFGTAYATGTAPAYPLSTGASCSTNGELVCSSDGTQFGLCNWGKVSFQSVAAGTQCKDGKIQFADDYPGAAPSGVFPPSGVPYGSASAAPVATGA